MENEFNILLESIFNIKDKGTRKEIIKLKDLLKRELDFLIIEERKWKI